MSNWASYRGTEAERVSFLQTAEFRLGHFASHPAFPRCHSWESSRNQSYTLWLLRTFCVLVSLGYLLTLSREISGTWCQKILVWGISCPQKIRTRTLWKSWVSPRLVGSRLKSVALGRPCQPLCYHAGPGVAVACGVRGCYHAGPGSLTLRRPRGGRV